MTEFISRVCHGESRYEVIIKTDNEDHYKAAEEFARRLIGHEKPQTNADRIRAMSDEKLAEFLYRFEYGVEELGAHWDCQGEALEWLREPTDQDEDEDQDEEEDKRLQRSGRWIPVTERLPDTIPCGAGTEYSEAVNVLTDGRKVLTAIWNGSHWICDAEFWDAEDEEITHWTPVLLPLPEPLKGE